ncbi:MAG: peptide deformylase [Dehalococcoidales bacterium]|nr:peptide deformylase [Dehalococcoidales bacterium]
MAKIREIRVMPDPVLRQKAVRVPEIDKSIIQLVDDMIMTMQKSEGVGLAAPQVGVSLRVITLQMPDQEPFCIINPEITKRNGEVELMEGCLSVPGYQGEVIRSVSIVAKGLNLKGEKIKIKAGGLLSQAIEHETDHLDGILYIDRLENDTKLYKIEPQDTREEPACKG